MRFGIDSILWEGAWETSGYLVSSLATKMPDSRAPKFSDHFSRYIPLSAQTP